MLCDVLLPLIWLPICQTDETLSGYAPRGVPFLLEELGESPVDAEVWLTIPGRKRLMLLAPCGTYLGDQRLPYPWFAFQLTETQSSDCTPGALEVRVIAALEAATLVEIGTRMLILSDETGAEMVFGRLP